MIRSTLSSQIVFAVAFSVYVTGGLLVPGGTPGVFAQEEQADDKPAQSDAPAKPVDDDPLGLNAADEDAGQSLLDEAVVQRFDAKSVRQLKDIESKLRGALKKGVSGENESFARKMLGSVLLQQSQLIVQEIPKARGARQLELRDDALRVLQSAVKADGELVEAYLMIARLNLSPGGDKTAVAEATTKAIELLEDNPVERSAAYVLRALTWDPTQDDKILGDLDDAIRDDPANMEAYQARAALRLKFDDVDGAVDDMEKILEKNPTNQQIAQVVVQKLAEMERLDDAAKLLSKALEAKPSEGLYRMRAIVYRMLRKDDQAMADLNKALAMQPKDPLALLQRANIALSRDDVQAAKRDLRAAEKIAPGVAAADQAIEVRCYIALQEGRMADAINEMQKLVQRDPSSMPRTLQLASLYLEDDRTEKGIDLLTSILDRDPTNGSALRMRAGAYLSTGEHRQAIADYELALEEMGDDESDAVLSNILNNLAWVLATSPNDDLRDAEKAIKFGLRAVEVTEEKEAHILSTLAAGYAEAGNFEKAIEWSKRAVELGEKDENPQIDQLKEELESYQKGKPWREKQETEENDVPILSEDDLIDT